MTYQERRLVQTFAALEGSPSKDWVSSMERIYKDNLSEYRHPNRSSLEMRFLSEVFSPCVDSMLKATYRRELNRLAADAKRL